MRTGIGMALAGALLLATPVFAQPIPHTVRSGAMPESGIDNAQTAGSDYGGMPLHFAKPKAKAHGKRAPAASSAPVQTPSPKP